MIGLIQRVAKAEVQINGANHCSIDQGIVILLGIEVEDSIDTVDRMIHKIINYRIFSDENKKMNLSLQDINGHLLVVPQFTLSANTKKGLRPSFKSVPVDFSKNLFENFVLRAKDKLDNVKSGVFAADMQVSLVNDGPVTFWIHI
ncbi:D-tyrosyl-tRNA(Tyr) deacylase [Paraphotobacterium marinum]|uniref:D-aminoacyl-tRNA deacylase n=1 Tax=Paraphotobacterium marinum TaxID=1755811 RepID=A0A220VCQ6_9GAMM|nr:D-aminoacyl-tRNA deacylase [Paraphotobacterium marinum]ASK78188.1 D-tyrosyl-tRNA(Tyr) deacylase [Paraphotobacterium marinum]